MNQHPPFRCGHVAIVGRPNVGKSTLLNRLIGCKLCITSRKPQTTRHRILGIKTQTDHQVAYVDTPGLHRKAPRAINRYMNRMAAGAISDVDVILFLVEALRWHSDDNHVLQKLSGSKTPIFAVVNKVDRLESREALLPYLQELSGRMPFAEIVPVSARGGDNIERLETLILDRLPENPPLYPEEQFTDRSVRFLVSEIVREKLVARLGQEVPHRLSVEVESFEEEEGLTRISAIIWVEEKGQKAIVIGKQGDMLKRVGVQARKDIEALIGQRVFIKLWVKVKSGWSDDERALLRLGYGD